MTEKGFSIDELVNYLEKEVWDFEELEETLEDTPAFKKGFTPTQRTLILQIAKTILKIREYHQTEEEEPHEKLHRQLRQLNENFMKHRHQKNGSYGGHAEL